MIAAIIIGLGMGMAAGLHCIGMCGPLALSLPINGPGRFARVKGALLYNTGRVTTYVSLGVLLGLLGRGISITGYQQWLSIAVGTIMLLLLLGAKYMPPTGPGAFFQQRIKRALSYFLLGEKRPVTFFVIGMLNGLLPCGMVYMAIATALVIGNPLQSGLLMAAFGLGTVPLMGLLMLAGHKLSFPLRNKLKRGLPWFTAFIACLMILRGLNLGIPYVSPAFSGRPLAEKIMCHP
ncbi:sulfite exporter TauE/SafE family protein [Niabella soli]|uniref:Cytochrome C biogenesis protein n=1 Tax=Niabella soli DSM 19437 TaxID=929713 RepID=W0EWZ7_9BACT|nr:sulfite exporter TauE/SafE family protein [Niabella soli]AHF15292.1 cytochrome C biogenesis protein [Niabella soli DSM 19437]